MLVDIGILYGNIFYTLLQFVDANFVLFAYFNCNICRRKEIPSGEHVKSFFHV